jgi:hypothetical protein
MLRVLMTAAVVLGVTAGCSSSSANRDGGPGSGGTGGAVHCRPVSDAGTNCSCSSAGTNSLSECSGASVASTDHGYCCSGGGFCTCFRTACVNVPSIGYCECGDPFDDTNPRVDSCLQPAGGICCLDTGLHPSSCWCNNTVTSCPSGMAQVTSCSLADVMNCRADETVVDRCN